MLRQTAAAEDKITALLALPGPLTSAQEKTLQILYRRYKKATGQDHRSKIQRRINQLETEHNSLKEAEGQIQTTHRLIRDSGRPVGLAETKRLAELRKRLKSLEKQLTRLRSDNPGRTRVLWSNP